MYLGRGQAGRMSPTQLRLSLQMVLAQQVLPKWGRGGSRCQPVTGMPGLNQLNAVRPGLSQTTLIILCLCCMSIVRLYLIIIIWNTQTWACSFEVAAETVAQHRRSYVKRTECSKPRTSRPATGLRKHPISHGRAQRRGKARQHMALSPCEHTTVAP
ncbi:hypothetical protein SKAU_G00310490 [Synaphobranchus kaupii]|uniref:Uncharacterized protein n=1 Tax=Synaphobranchus kaupii TaxID=118154 RepID=A0A9Q1ILB0_SYNKA|nr:hypothetical protein SKAU_G00310490 [Synaphobranchus kaupii]